MQALIPNCLILYVASVAHSVEFYRHLLGAAPLEHHPGFASFQLGERMVLGLWARADVLPVAEAAPGAAELVIQCASPAEVDARHAAWLATGWPDLQAPMAMDFGYTATTADPDGHRVRVFCPTAS
ncbi:VOC family protein [Inhella proteolytica]|uniref:Drug:proton antiporter n=1 Tax=Inhella proteolytica TaxID=2795029 RepID=A0A931NII8_9BURK|nr:VOC family protein [Inhella proteolytica]MBH9578089.1 drug:proton antiporter [Inhella proteolytica]